MKNITDVQKEVRAIENTPKVEIATMKPVEWRRQLKKLELLRTLVKYLETYPTESFVKSEISRLEKVVSSKMKIFDEAKVGYIKDGLVPKEIAKLKTKHESLYDLKKMRTQIRNLRTLLK